MKVDTRSLFSCSICLVIRHVSFQEKDTLKRSLLLTVSVNKMWQCKALLSRTTDVTFAAMHSNCNREENNYFIVKFSTFKHLKLLIKQKTLLCMHPKNFNNVNFYKEKVLKIELSSPSSHCCCFHAQHRNSRIFTIFLQQTFLLRFIKFCYQHIK